MVRLAFFLAHIQGNFAKYLVLIMFDDQSGQLIRNISKYGAQEYKVLKQHHDHCGNSTVAAQRAGVIIANDANMEMCSQATISM
jgi:hypothetical protein